MSRGLNNAEEIVQEETCSVFWGATGRLMWLEFTQGEVESNR